MPLVLLSPVIVESFGAIFLATTPLLPDLHDHISCCLPLENGRSTWPPFPPAFPFLPPSPPLDLNALSLCLVRHNPAPSRFPPTQLRKAGMETSDVEQLLGVRRRPCSAGDSGSAPEPLNSEAGLAAAEAAGQKAEIDVGEGMHYNRTGTWRDLLPFRKLSPEEWEAYQRKKNADFQAKWVASPSKRHSAACSSDDPLDVTPCPTPFISALSPMRLVGDLVPDRTYILGACGSHEGRV